MSSDNEITEEWYVCFGGKCEKHWVQKLLRVGFYHCYAFKLSPGGQFYIVVNPVRSHTDIDLLPVNDENFNKLTNCTKFVKVICNINADKDRGHVCRFNCVEMIKSLIGVSSFWTWTPLQLYRSINHG